MANNRPVEPDQEIEPAQENENCVETRGLPYPEMNFSNVAVEQSVTESNTAAIPKIINHSSGRKEFRDVYVHFHEGTQACICQENDFIYQLHGQSI